MAGQPFSPMSTKKIAEQFFRDGYVYIPNVLTPGEVSTLRERTDQLLDDPDLMESTNPNLADVRYVQLGKHQTTGEDLPFILRNNYVSFIFLNSHESILPLILVYIKVKKCN